MTKKISKTLDCTIDTNSFTFIQDNNTTSCYPWYKDYYFPYTYNGSPKKDKCRIAYDIIKILMDEHLIQIKTVKNFTDLMDKIMIVV